MSSPELQFDPFDLSPNSPEAAPAPGSAAALKQQVAERIAAHRSKRGRHSGSNLIPIPSLDLPPAPAPAQRISQATKSSPMPAAKLDASPELQPEPQPEPKPRTVPGNSRANRIAAAVAERYAHSTTYREFLAAEAERAIAQANATAEIAARNAEAVTAVQQRLLAELDFWDDPAPRPPGTEVPATTWGPHSSQSPGAVGERTGSLGWQSDEWATATTTPAPTQEPRATNRVPHSSQSHRDEWAATTPAVVAPQSVVQQPLTSGLTVRLFEDVGLRQPEPRIACAAEPHDPEALNHLDDEIAFRHAPVFDEPAAPPVPIPANLLEFPRQLVAARKSRPRIAEGPLREEADAAPTAAQLRIFEVDASQFSTAPTAEPETSLPEWSSIHLDATPVIPTEAHAATAASSEAQLQTALYVPIQVAPLGHRFMAAAVDACLLGATFLAAVSAFAYAVKSLPTGPVALIASAATLLVLFILYHMLFFTLSCATPGMRYARIGLCTFSDDNPTRAEMRRRVWFVLLAASPLGLGILWSLLDEDTLGWHDRLSRIYQRSY